MADPLEILIFLKDCLAQIGSAGEKGQDDSLDTKIIFRCHMHHLSSYDIYVE